MTRLTRLLAPLIAACYVLVAVCTAGTREEACEHLQMGMIPFDEFPNGNFQDCTGLDMTDDMIMHMQKAAGQISFGEQRGSSGGFISASGLFATNWHVALQCIQNLENAKEVLENGFFAKTIADELRCPGATIRTTQGITDITKRVTEATRGKDPAETETSQRTAIDAIETECQEQYGNGFECQVYAFRQGAQYKLYVYRTYDDVRLHRAPPASMAFCDLDNFDFARPTTNGLVMRVAVDYAEWRAWDSDKPAVTPYFFKPDPAIVSDEDLVMSIGFPGNTKRAMPYSSYRHEQNYRTPFWLNIAQRSERWLLEYANRGPEFAAQVSKDLLIWQNSKKLFGYTALVLPDTLRMKKAEERELHRFARRYNIDTKAFDDLKSLYQELEAMYGELNILDYGLIWGPLWQYGQNFVRMANEMGKSSPKRLLEFQDAKLEVLKRDMTSDNRSHKDVEERRWELALQILNEVLGPKDRDLVTVMQGKSPVIRAREIVQGTELDNTEFRLQLFEGGARAIMASGDPVLVFLRVFDTRSRQLRAKYDQLVVARKGAMARVMSLRERTFASQPPDANNTVRLTFGRVSGYIEAGGISIPICSTMGQVETHWRAHESSSEPLKFFHGPWEGETQLNCVSSLDMVGGGSGSPTLLVKNGELKFVGLQFDSNRYKIASDLTPGPPATARAIFVTYVGAEHMLCKLGLGCNNDSDR